MKFLITLVYFLLSVQVAGALGDEHGHGSDRKKKSTSKQTTKTATEHDHDEHEEAPKHSKDENKAEGKLPQGHDEKHEEQAHTKEEEHDHKESGHTDEHGDGEKAQSDEHGEEEASASVGPGKAVLEVKDEGNKLKLSPEAQQKINLQFSKITVQGGSARIPKAALLEYQANTAIYRLNPDGLVELIPVKVSKREADTVVISGKLSANEQIATSGVALLRAAQLEASGQGGEGHGH